MLPFLPWIWYLSICLPLLHQHWKSKHQHTWPESANGFNWLPCFYSCPHSLLYQAVKVIFKTLQQMASCKWWSPIRCPRMKMRCCTVVYKGLAPADAPSPQLWLVPLSPDSLQPGLADLVPVPRWCQGRVYPCQLKHCWEEGKRDWIGWPWGSKSDWSSGLRKGNWRQSWGLKSILGQKKIIEGSRAGKKTQPELCILIVWADNRMEWEKEQ